MAGFLFQTGVRKLAVGDIDWNTSTIKLILMKKGAGASLDQDTHDFFDDIKVGKRAGAADKIVTITGSTDMGTPNRVLLKATVTSVTFNTVSTDSIEGYVIYKESGGASNTDPLLAYNTLTSIVDSDGGSFKVTFDSDGLIRMSFANV